MAKKTEEELRENGAVKVEGKEYVLLDRAFLEGTCEGDAYKADAICFDEPVEDGCYKVYELYWDIRDEYDPAEEDESQACDWENPYDIKELGCRYDFEEGYIY